MKTYENVKTWLFLGFFSSVVPRWTLSKLLVLFLLATMMAGSFT